MKLIKRRTQIVYKEISELEWQVAYSRYLEIRLLRNNHGVPSYNSFEEFKLFAANIWCPIAEVEKDVESEETFIQRVTKVEAKENYTDLQFITNTRGEIVSCVLF